MSDNFDLVSAIWYKGPKTKFLQLKLDILLHQTDAVVTVEPAVPQGVVPTVLLVDVKVEPGKGPMKGVVTPVEPPALVTVGNEPWTHVQARYEGFEDTEEIEVRNQEASTKGDGNDGGGSKSNGGGGSYGGSKRQEGGDNDCS